jgi:type III pantothenate kinase
MLLAINCNNTNTVFSVWDEAGMRGVWRSATDPARTADEYVVWLDQLMSFDGIKRRAITGAIVANVVPEAHFNLDRLVRHYYKSEPLFVGEPGVEIGARALVDRPDEVGADRLVNTVAAHERYKAPVIVVDFGTATTFDVVDRDGNYCGGVIAPGINLSLRALHMAAAKLPSVRIERPPTVIGKSTIQCMQSGIFWGYVGLVEGIVARIREERGEPMEVVATGGLASLFEGATPAIKDIDKTLTLRGLWLIYRRNKA